MSRKRKRGERSKWEQGQTGSDAAFSGRGLVSAFCWTAGAGALGGTILGFSRYWPLELWSHFRVQYMVTFVVLAIGTMALKRWKLAAVCVAGAGLNAWLVAPHAFGAYGTALKNRGGQHGSEAGARAESDLRAGRLRLFVANVFRPNSMFNQVLAEIERHDPDVIVLQEVNARWGRELRSLDEKYPHRLLEFREDAFGIALWSKAPLAEPRVLFPGWVVPSLFATLHLEGVPVLLVGTHPPPPAGRRGSIYRNRQLQDLSALLQAHDGAVIVAGDLNSTPWSPHFQEFAQSSRLSDPRRGRGIIPTWPVQAWPLRIPIDHCLVRSLEVVAFERGADLGSDHFPLIIEVRLESRGADSAIGEN